MRTTLPAPALAVLLAAGCSNPPPAIVEAEGAVFLDDEPLPRAKVRFIPQVDHGPEFIATAETDDRGHFVLRCNGKAGACACGNVVTVSEGDVPEKLLSEHAQHELARYRQGLTNRPIPTKYDSAAATPLFVTVVAGKKTYNLHLER